MTSHASVLLGDPDIESLLRWPYVFIYAFIYKTMYTLLLTYNDNLADSQHRRQNQNIKDKNNMDIKKDKLERK